MTQLSDLMDTDQLCEEIDAGYVRQQVHHRYGYEILNYTEKAQYSRRWNDITRQCRGLIVAEDDTVIARPFAKFFNYGEAEAPEIKLDDVVEITNKMDGSLGIMYPTPDGPAIATRGSFHGEQAEHATALLRSKYPLMGNEYEWTALFEIIYPQNRIVCDYGDQDDLVLLGCIRISDGQRVGPNILGWPGPRAEILPGYSFLDALLLPDREGAEGIVVRRCSDNAMVKVKQEDYVALHRIVTGLSERTIWEQMSQSGVGIDEVVEPLPDELQKWARGVAQGLLDQFAAIWNDSMALHREIVAEVGYNDRKAFAMKAKDSELRPFLFNILDGRNPFPAIWKSIKPAGDNRLRPIAEEAE